MGCHKKVEEMFHLKRFTLTITITVLFFGLAGCAGETIEEGFYNPDSRAARDWEDEHTGDDENLGPNSPGYTGPNGEYSVFPDYDPQ